MRIVVVGAGISGLAAAWRARAVRPDAEVLVLESTGAVGGKVTTAEVAGHAVDVGAEALLVRSPVGIELINALGLAEDLISPLTLAAGVFAGGTHHRLPGGTMLGVPGDVAAARESGLFSEAALARIEAEREDDSPPPLTEDVPVGRLVRERLGDEVADRLLEPLLGGVYAGRADRISLDAALPALAARLRSQGGSLVGAAAAVVEDGRRLAADGPPFASLRGGLGRLTAELASSGRFEVRTGVTVTGIARTGSGFRLTTGATNAREVLHADRVVVAVPARKAAVLLREVAPAAARELGGVETASVAIVTLAFRTSALAAGAGLPSGSGLLVAPTEGYAVKATTFSSQKWPGAPAGLTVLRASLGRLGESVVLQRDDAELTRLTRSDLTRLIGLTTAPVDSRVTRWAGGLPQYDVGHLARVARVRAAVSAVPGLGVCGAVFDGVGIPACIGSAYGAVAQVGLTAGDQEG